MSSMLAKSLKTGFKPKVARRNAPASGPPSSERLSKTPAPTASQPQPPPPPGPSASPAPATTPARAPNSAPEPAPSTSRAESDRLLQVAEAALKARGEQDVPTSPQASRKGPGAAGNAQGARTNTTGSRAEVTGPAVEKDIADTAPMSPTTAPERSDAAARQPPTETLTAVPEPPAAATPTRSKVPASPRTRGGPAKAATPQPSPARTRARNPRGAPAQEAEQVPAAAPQMDNAASTELQAINTEPAATTEPEVTERTDGTRRAAPRGRKRKADAAPDAAAGGGSSSQADADTGPQTAGPKKAQRRRAAALPGEEGYQTAAQKRAAAGATKQTRKRKSPTEGEETPAAETGDESGGAQPSKKRVPPRRHREVTPEDAETIEIDVTQVKMADLIKDMRTGKKFSLHDELMERERMKRQKWAGKKKQQDGETAVASADSATPYADSSGSGSGSTPAEPVARTGPAAGETYRIVDGVIVVDSGSLQVDRHARAAEEAGEMEEREENEFTHHTTSATYLRRNMKPRQWADDETDKFFWALSMFGTDFETIAKMFPGKTRKHIKLKFNREERAAPARIQAALVGQKTVGMDMDEYKRHTGVEYETAEAIYAEQKKAEEEFEARQKALQEAKEEEARKRREELFGSASKEGDKDQDDSGKKKKGRGRKAKRAGVTW